MRVPVLLVLCVSFALPALSGCSLPYLMRQVAGGVRVIASARPVAEAIRDRESLSLVQRARLAEVGRALGLAERSGLDVGDSYQDFVDLHGRPLVYVLYASPKDRLQSKVWRFPIVGAFPYKGFFDLEAARREAEGLAEDGLETMIVPATAYSMLGWLPDPIFSSMLEGAAGERCEVLFHELTHRTVFIGDSVPFNENLASFVGTHLAEGFLVEEYGADSAELRTYRGICRDRELFLELVGGVQDELEEAYRADSREERLAGRERIFANAHRRYSSLPFRTEKYRGLTEARWSNPFVLSISIYHGRRELFADALRACDGDLPRLFAVLQELNESGGDPEANLSEWLEAAGVTAPSP